MISFNIKHLGWKGMACSALVAAATLTACSDWDDHFDANSSVLDSQHSTLWQQIEKAENLKEFASLLKKTGYDEKLSASQTYTVWAPVDGSFDYDVLSNYSDARVLREFVENHIARNNYPVSGQIDQRIYMLNEKKMLFNGSSDYSIQGIKLIKPNMSSCSNGTLHAIDGKVPFLSSIYESLSNFDYPIDSLSAYVLGYDEKKIDESKSKKGPVTNGEQTYLDTVYYEHNELFSYYDAFINREDSSYTMIAPTNTAWNKAMTTVKSYFNYLPQFDFYEKPAEKVVQKVTLQDAAAMRDSVSKVAMYLSLIYNNNVYDNKKLKTLQTGEPLAADSLMSTTGTKMYSEDAANLFAHATRLDKSNGALWVTDDSLHMRTWTLWNPEIRIEAEYSNYWAGSSFVSNDQPEAKAVNKQNDEVLGKISNNYYLEVAPNGMAVNPEIYFYLPNVRSTEYSVYVVFVPGNINSKNFSGPLKKNHMDVVIGYADEKGKNVESTFKDIEPAVDSLLNVEGATAKIDTTYIGDITFPASYVGLFNSSSLKCAPYMRLRSRVSSKQSSIYDRTMRIDCIILRPKNLDDYIKAHPDYKYDRNLY